MRSSNGKIHRTLHTIARTVRASTFSPLALSGAYNPRSVRAYVRTDHYHNNNNFFFFRENEKQNEMVGLKGRKQASFSSLT